MRSCFECGSMDDTVVYSVVYDEKLCLKCWMKQYIMRHPKYFPYTEGT